MIGRFGMRFFILGQVMVSPRTEVPKELEVGVGGGGWLGGCGVLGC